MRMAKVSNQGTATSNINDSRDLNEHDLLEESMFPGPEAEQARLTQLAQIKKSNAKKKQNPLGMIHMPCEFTVIGIIVLIAGIALYYLCKEPDPSTKLFESASLAKYNGDLSSPLYLAILGEVFDVSRAPQFYGKGKGYNHFVGRDGSRAFATGDFKKDLNDDVWDLTPDQMAGLVSWRAFYRKEYAYKGRVIGKFYNKTGGKLRLLDRVEKAVVQVEEERAKRKAAEVEHPNCNVRWSEGAGGTAWCDDGMYPRQVLKDQDGGSPATRCACFKEMGWNDMRRVYASCKPDAHSCQTSPPKAQKK